MKVLGLNMYTVHLGTLGIIRNFQWIAAITTFKINKAGLIPACLQLSLKKEKI
jgi:hypothetical protein